MRLRPERPDHVWAYDFILERTRDGRAARLLTVIDEYTRECLAIRAERRIRSIDVIATLADLMVTRGVPEHIRSDNGPEFTSRAVREWLGNVGAKTLYIEPGSPWENGYVESFNGKLRDELLDREVFNRILHTFGFANLPGSRHRDDGLTLHDAYITAALRCPPPANKPLREELANCKPYLLEELSLLANVRVVVALGKIAFDAYLGTCADRGLAVPLPRPRFGHGVNFTLEDGIELIASYHPSQQNTQTGRLTPAMFEAVFKAARQMLRRAR